MNDVVREFLVETQENLAQLDLDLVALEKDPADREILAHVFRTLHTLKGTAGFIGLLKLQTVTHAAESLLTPMMEGELVPTSAVIGGLLATVDVLRQIIAELDRSGQEEDIDVTPLLEQLAALQTNSAQGVPLASLRNAITPLPTDAAQDEPEAAALPEEPALQERKDFSQAGEIVREFLVETQESLAQLDLDLVALEKDPADREILAHVFRTLHTLKGTAGFIGLLKLQTVTHAAESLLTPMMEGELVPTSAVIGGLLATVDVLRQIIAELDRSGQEEDIDVTPLLEQLAALQTNSAQGVPLASLRNAITPLPTDAVQDEPEAAALPERRREPSPVAPPPKPIVASAPARKATPPPAPAPVAPRKRILMPPPPPPDEPDFSQPPVSERQRLSAFKESTIRIDVRLLDDLMGMIGELVLTRNQILRFTDALDNHELLSSLLRLDTLTTNLQAGVMKTRMQPIGSLWSKFPRIVRDMAAACGKQARLEVEGADTELDRTILEAIRDPLTHIIRNSIDHGIETPELRRRRHKPEEGRLLMQAHHEAGQIIIKISDDGGGIDPQIVREKAIRAGIVSPQRAELMSERSLLNLIFMPGFSTAEEVTQFSGRGVGMNVVRTNVEKIGGTIQLESQLERGTTLHIKIPLTLAIIPALLVQCAGDCYVIPQLGLEELISLEREQARASITYIRNTPLYSFRGKQLPLVFLDELLKIGNSRSQLSLADMVNIVVVQADDRKFGIIVDEINELSDIVVKPLQHTLKKINIFAGATLLGDGRIAMILDVLGLARRAKIISSVRARIADEDTGFAVGSVGELFTVILCAGPDGRRLALPLSRVTRLEEFPRRGLEWLGNRVVIQYSSGILPLVDVCGLLGISSKNHRSLAMLMEHDPEEEFNEQIQVVVHAVGERAVGLYVNEILDILEETIINPTPSNQPLVLFSCIIQGRVTEFLDIDSLLSAAGFAVPAEESALMYPTLTGED